MAEQALIRPGTAADLKAMAALEQAAAINPWSLSQFLESSLRDSDASLVIQSAAGELLGFAVYQRVLDEVTLMNIAVAPTQQGLGYGTRLLRALLEDLDGQDVARLLLEVRRGNAAAIALYQKLGFVEDGVRPDYYPSATGREDALLMSHRLEVAA